jgi:hypothetical protein
VQAAVVAMAGPGDTLVVARNCHLSAFSGMVVAGGWPGQGIVFDLDFLEFIPPLSWPTSIS